MRKRLVNRDILIRILEAWVVLRSCLCNKRIRNLIRNKVGVVLRKMDAVRTRIRYIYEEPSA